MGHANPARASPYFYEVGLARFHDIRSRASSGLRAEAIEIDGNSSDVGMAVLVHDIAMLVIPEWGPEPCANVNEAAPLAALAESR
eukprot:5641071-Pyramimonas_sp.AAC.1